MLKTGILVVVMAGKVMVVTIVTGAELEAHLPTKVVVSGWQVMVVGVRSVYGGSIRLQGGEQPTKGVGSGLV